MIYGFVFELANGEILGLSREPEHDYDFGPPSDWIADSRQEGLVYDTKTARTEFTNSRFLRTCRIINNEATEIFYGRNKIILYAEDNNDIFYWLLDIGEHNRRAIRRLEISWAYGVSIQSGRQNIHGVLERINTMTGATEEDVQKHREQLINTVREMEHKTVRLGQYTPGLRQFLWYIQANEPSSPVIRTLNLLVSNQDLISLGVYLPGIDGGDIWDLPNDNIYFAEELFSNSTSNVHGCIPIAISKMLGIETLTVGYTKDIKLAEEIARLAGAKKLSRRHGFP